MSQTFKPLDIVQTPSGAIAIITDCWADEDDFQQISLQYLANCKTTDKCAWWSNRRFSNTVHVLDDLVLLDSIPHLLANAVAHNMGSCTKQGNRFFPLDQISENK